MPECQGQAITANAEFYLNRLCKHFSHKVPVRRGDGHADIDFGIGSCRLHARTNELAVHCEAPDAKALQEVAETIESHLERFGAREALLLRWQ